jgi:ACS family hexuronate transporter-like MFS transporter
VAISGNRKKLLFLVLLFATILNYLDRQVLSLVAERVMAEFHLDRRGFGEILSSFRYSYAALQFFGGWLVDAIGPRIVFPLAVGFWSFAGLGTAFSQSMAGLRGWRFALGIGEAFNWPCALKTTGQLLAPGDRAMANGIFNGGTALGAILAPIVVTALAAQSGWRSPFILTGASGAGWAIAWMFTTRGLFLKSPEQRITFRTSAGVMMRILLRREFWLLTASAVIVNGVSYFLADWIPLYLKTDRSFGFVEGNVLSILVYGGLDAGNILGGYVVHKALSRGFRIDQARLWALVASCVLMTCAVPAGLVPWRFVSLVCIALSAIGVAGFLVTYLTTLQDVDPLHVGTVAGMLGGLGNLAYGILAPYIGRLSDLHRTDVIFILTGLLPWLAYACLAPVIKAKSYAIHT